MEERYSKGIRAGMKAMENAKLDYKATIERLAEACKWKAETTSGWVEKGEVACGNLLERAEAALKEADEKEEAEAKIRIMETQCEELVNLAVQAGKQVPAEAEAEVLEELEEEMDHREGMVEGLGRALRETVPESLKDRVEEALKESVAMAARGRRYVDHVRARLDFSKDSESSSSKAATGAAPGGWQTAAEELGEVLGEEFGDEAEEPGGLTESLELGGVPEDEAAGARRAAPRYLVDFMRSFGQMRANDSGWPTFDGRAYHSAVSDDLAARTLRDKCLQGDALQMVSHLDDPREMWETLDTCYERPDKYMEEALRPIVDFRRYKITDSAAVREFYSLLRAAIKGARRVGRIELLINDQTIPRIMGKMPHVDWKE
jgi:F0F1-type ATP synthase membrane subunit b/b'